MTRHARQSQVTEVSALIGTFVILAFAGAIYLLVELLLIFRTPGESAASALLASTTLAHCIQLIVMFTMVAIAWTLRRIQTPDMVADTRATSQDRTHPLPQD